MHSTSTSHGGSAVEPPTPSASLTTISPEEHAGLLEHAKVLVQQHMGIPHTWQTDAVAQAVVYPPAQATHGEVYEDSVKFHDTLHNLYDALGIKVSKMMKLGGQELNLHLLYQRVTDAGGAVQVIKDKQWRDVGDAFHLRKTITSVSYVLKRAYMNYLWDYEQVYFQGRAGQPRVAAPQSRYTREGGGGHGEGVSALKPGAMAPAVRPMALAYAHPAGNLVSSVDAAAAMAVAALRARCDWATAASAHSYGPGLSPATCAGVPQPMDCQTTLPAATSLAAPALPAVASAPVQSKAAMAGDVHVAPASLPVPMPFVPPVAAAPQLCSVGAVHLHHASPTSSELAGRAPDGSTATTFCGMLEQMPVRELQPGAVGSVECVMELGTHGFLVSGAMGGTRFTGVLGAPGAPCRATSAPTAHDACGARNGIMHDGPHVPTPAPESVHEQESVQVGQCTEEPSSALLTPQKRMRMSPEHATKHGHEDERTFEVCGSPEPGALHSPELPESVLSLLAKIGLDERGSMSTNRAAELWMAMDAHQRELVQTAVCMDEQRYAAEHAARQAQVNVRLARQRRHSAVCAARAAVLQLNRQHSDTDEQAGQECVAPPASLPVATSTAAATYSLPCDQTATPQPAATLHTQHQQEHVQHTQPHQQQQVLQHAQPQQDGIQHVQHAQQQSPLHAQQQQMAALQQQQQQHHHQQQMPNQNHHHQQQERPAAQCADSVPTCASHAPPAITTTRSPTSPRSAQPPGPYHQVFVPHAPFFSSGSIGGFPFYNTSSGGTAVQREGILGPPQGPAASPNVPGRPYDLSRHMVYQQNTSGHPSLEQLRGLPVYVAASAPPAAAHTCAEPRTGTTDESAAAPELALDSSFLQCLEDDEDDLWDGLHDAFAMDATETT